MFDARSDSLSKGNDKFTVRLFGKIVGVGSVADVGPFESAIGEEGGCIREGIEVLPVT